MTGLAALVPRLAGLYPWPCEPVIAWATSEGTVAEVAGEEQSASVQRALASMRATLAELADGDVIVANDPMAGAADATQLTLVRVLSDGFAVVRARIPDIGGFALGGVTREGYDVWGEGARFPALRLFVAGEARPQSRMLLTLNSRTPNLLNRAVDALLDVSAGVTGAGPPRDDAPGAAPHTFGLADGDYRADATAALGDGWPQPVVRGRLQVSGATVRLDLSGSDHESVQPFNCAVGLSLDTIARALSARLGGTPAAAALDAIEVDLGHATVVSPSERARVTFGPLAVAPALAAVVGALLTQAGLGPDAGDDVLPLAADAAQRLDPDGCCVVAGRLAAIRELEATEAP